MTVRHSIKQARPRDETGFVAVLFAISAMALVVVAGFGIDLGSWYLTAARLQRATDMAALAGAAQLPNQPGVASAVTSAFAENGFQDSGSISISQTISAGSVKTTITDNSVPTYFLRIILGSISMTRSSQAEYASNHPTLGSPYNALGTGNLSIPGIPTANFWLAINGECVPAEDGDLFDAHWDANKEGIDNNTGLGITPSAHHDCGGGVSVKNNAWDPGGYVYYVDVPSVPSGGSVAIRVYNASWNNNPGSPDRDLSLKADGGQGIDTAFVVRNANGDASAPTAGTVLMQGMETAFDNQRPGAEDGWLTLTSVSSPGLYSVQVFPDQKSFGLFDTQSEVAIHGFSLIAQRSWGTMGCDSRISSDCPTIYAAGAESVLNNLPSAGATDFYFARVPSAFAGGDIDAYLWDPGEGVQQIQFLGPDGNPLPFDWTATQPCPTNPGGTNVTSLPTIGTCAPPKANLSNTDMFNDRLVTATIHLPANYGAMIQSAGGDDYIRIRYTVSGAPNDRTTWGASLPGGLNGLDHLVGP